MSLRKELEEYLKLEENWDGEGAVAPSLISIFSAIRFVDRLVNTRLTLFDRELDLEYAGVELLPHNGNAGVFWNTDKLFLEIELVGRGMARVYMKEGNAVIHKGVLEVPQ